MILHETEAFEIDAAKFASEAHTGQKRKYTGEAYITHPRAVAQIVKTVPHTNEMICAAWLHDVVEDCEVSLSEIEQVFGPKIAELVEMLTDVSKPSDGNRKIRKQIDLLHTSKASPEAKTIKLADLIHNTKSIVKHDPAFAEVYLSEKVALLEVLKEGDATLWKIANEQINIVTT